MTPATRYNPCVRGGGQTWCSQWTQEQVQNGYSAAANLSSPLGLAAQFTCISFSSPRQDPHAKIPTLGMAAMYSATALSELNSPEAVALHSLMERLSSCGVGEIVDIPQMIVVGQQAVGKSSVLEAITSVKFPTSAGLCTRFATEIILGQAQEESVHVTIRSHKSEPQPARTFDESGLSKKDLPALIEEAKKCMGITENMTGFSRHVLCVQIRGPDVIPLRLVDLPGIFNNEIASQSEKGIEIVNQLVESYMEQKNSIILVVVEAKTAVVNHYALAKVKDFDPKRERTMGIITKPDLKLGEHLQKEHIQLAKNREPKHTLKLGWHVLRNRAEDEDGTGIRDQIEDAFFKTSPWNSIVEEDRGIHSLRRKLSSVLYNHIRRGLPKVIEDIETNLAKRQAEKAQLGVARPKLDDKRVFLADIAEQFQRLVRDAMRGNYADQFFGQLTTPLYRLRADLKCFHRAFDYTMITRGHKFEIDPFEGEEEEEERNPVDSVPEALVDFLARNPYDFETPAKKSRKDINDLLVKPVVASEGSELPGTCNSEVAVHLFQLQSGPWKDIARFHVACVIRFARFFIERLFVHIIGQDGEHLDAIISEYVDPFFEKHETILEAKLDELLAPYANGYAVPSDAEFRQIVSCWTVNRVAKRLRNLQDSVDDTVARDGPRRIRHDFVSAAEELTQIVDGGSLGTERIVNMMQAYYEISRRTFLDNVTNLAVEGCLIQHLPSIFTSKQVAAMDESELHKLASESGDVQSRRDQLSQEIDSLKKGMEQCRRWRPRTELVNPTRPKNTSGADTLEKNGHESRRAQEVDADAPSSGATPAAKNFGSKPADQAAQVGKTSPWRFTTESNATAQSKFLGRQTPLFNDGRNMSNPDSQGLNSGSLPQTSSGGLFGSKPAAFSPNSSSSSSVFGNMPAQKAPPLGGFGSTVDGPFGTRIQATNTTAPSFPAFGNGNGASRLFGGSTAQPGAGGPGAQV
ncbi:Dynamin, GTPase domain protein [Cordyceps fumosorosea ARSEF 2679]|uniref:Dynamin, GTPase domain protein n=1 Tax=Cordyceps fumosorosea (strain ARSEF 2679) TaxID=1081104 RepID=A0A167NEE1_CORFA|nr:Dynamin, GTPase domain protein [Cordyceps fumosorosea ARSEF 2679]OAA55468.1 Dynamin, GTPase domain protein [Cordyceps fumosorosea ARSEF 2679]